MIIDNLHALFGGAALLGEGARTVRDGVGTADGTTGCGHPHQTLVQQRRNLGFAHAPAAHLKLTFGVHGIFRVRGGKIRLCRCRCGGSCGGGFTGRRLFGHGIFCGTSLRVALLFGFLESFAFKFFVLFGF